MDGDEPIAGCDPGYRDPTAFVVIVYQPVLDVYHIVDEYLKAEATTDKHAEAFQELIQKWQVDPIFIDSAAPQFASDLAYLYDIATIKAKKDVLPGIAFVQTLIETDRLVVSPHCTHTLAMLDQYRWDIRETITKEKPLHDEYSHMADAVRYALYTYTL
jgi:phage terminase large subunit